MSPDPVSTCPVLMLPKTEVGHQPQLLCLFPTSDLAGMNTFLASSAPLSLWKDRGNHSQHLSFHTPWKHQQAGAHKGISPGWSSPRASSLQLIPTRMNTAHKDAVINARRFLLSHHLLQQLVSTKGANRNCSKDCKKS